VKTKSADGFPDSEPRWDGDRDFWHFWDPSTFSKSRERFPKGHFVAGFKAATTGSSKLWFPRSSVARPGAFHLATCSADLVAASTN
jgi:hypothetical protein